jgi:hypothetical protein
LRAWASALALCAFFARALIPLGFMPGTVHGQAQIIVCPAGLHAMPGSPANGHHPDGAQHGEYSCAFAQSVGTAAAPPALQLLPVVALATGPIDLQRIDLPAAFGPDRQQSPRGPPA